MSSSRLRVAVERLTPAAPAVAISALLALLPFSTCLSRIALHVDCPACGATRAARLLVRAELAASLRMHPGVAPGALLVCVTVALALALPAGDPRWSRFARRAVELTALALVVVWVLRRAGALPTPP